MGLLLGQVSKRGKGRFELKRKILFPMFGSRIFVCV